MLKSRIANINDIAAVLDLQEKYLFANLTEAERLDGFQTTPFTAQQVEAIIPQHGLFLVEDGQDLAGYCYAGTWEFWSQWPIFPHMQTMLPQLTWRGQALSEVPTFQYGPICIDKKYRGKGANVAVFEAMRSVWQENYPISLTFINQINQRSYEAHVRKMGWEVVTTFTFNGRNYWYLAYDMSRSLV